MDAWSPAEDAELVGLHDSLGPRWSNISKMLTGRTAHDAAAVVPWWPKTRCSADGGAKEEGVEHGDGAPGRRGSRSARTPRRAEKN